ncbi:MAG: tetratricopeptide repeat protein [Holophagales bacterium]|nr:tetratricopeptide repeat protein [Holophagales bacterium]
MGSTPLSLLAFRRPSRRVARAGPRQDRLPRRPAAGRLAVLSSVVLALAACGADLPELEPVPVPELEAVEEGARRQIEEARATVAVAERRGEVIRLASAYGSLGEVHHAYGLHTSAGAAYRNAAVLDPNGFAWPYYLGLLAQESGDLEAARGHYERALGLSPRSAATRARLAITLLDLGRAEAAREPLEALAEERGYAALAAYGLGRAAASVGDPVAAEGHFRRALELQPAAGTVHHELAQALRAQGRLAEAEAELRHEGQGAITFADPLSERIETLATSASSFLRRGNRELVAENLDAAEKLFRRGLTADAEHVELRLNLGLLLVRQGRLDEALAEFEAAAEIDPENAQARHDIGTTQLALGNPEEAISAFRAALGIEADYTGARFNLANVLAGSKRWSEAEAELDRVLEADPGHERALYLRAMARHHQGESPGAEGELRALLEADPENRIFREGLAVLLSETRRRQEAAEEIRVGLELDVPVEEKVALARAGGQLLWKANRRNEAIEMWRRVTELEPESSQAFTDLANALQLVGRREEALTLFARAVELDPENATAWLSETSLWLVAGDYGTAHARLSEAVELHPGHAGLANAFARLLATAPDARLRDGERAIQMARLAYGVEPTLEHAETLPMALAEAGRFEQAIQFQRGLAQKAQMSGDRASLSRLVRNLRLYESRQPVRAAGS